MIKSVSINIRPGDEKSISILGELIEFFESKKIDIMLPKYDIVIDNNFSKYITDEETYVNNANLIVVLGGDGTFLKTIRFFYKSDAPIFGINRGRLGFLTEFNPDEYLKYLHEIIKGNYSIAERSILEAVLIRKGKKIDKFFFINDTVISKGLFPRPIEIELGIDGDFLNSFSGDGLIIATATGSTAYSLSSGGPIVSPLIDNVFIINPICPHSLSSRPMIIPAETSFKAKIGPGFKNLLLTIDGQLATQIESNDEIEFKMSKYKIKLINHPEKNYYAILKEKLGWGKCFYS